MVRLQTLLTPISLGFVNVFVLRGDRTILIDTGMPGSAGKILDELANNGIAPEDISLILLTHGHLDHFGSAYDLRQATGAPVAIHRLDAEPLRAGRNMGLYPVNWRGQLMHLMPRLTTQPLEPDILLDGDVELDDFGVRARILFTPGHTPGSISVLTPAGEIIVADLIFGGIVRRREPIYPFIATSMQEVKESIAKVLRIHPRKAFAGHGGPFSYGQLARKFSSVIL